MAKSESGRQNLLTYLFLNIFECENKKGKEGNC